MAATRPRPWHEDDEMWDLLSAAVFSNQRLEQATAEVESLITLARLRGGERVLDLPCGKGRHSIELARRGFAVTGVDRNATFLKEAGRRADEAGVEVEWVQDDMRSFRRPAAYDLVINMYTSLGYFDDPAEDLIVLQNFLASLRSGGRMVVELFGKEIIARTFRPREWHDLDDGSLMLEERTVEDQWRRIRNRWILVRDGRRIERTFGLRLYSAGELIALAEQAGFASAAAYGNLAGGPYDETAQRLVIVAAKR